MATNIKLVLSQVPPSLSSTPNTGWVRDLLRECVEPNPGPSWDIIKKDLVDKKLGGPEHAKQFDEALAMLQKILFQVCRIPNDVNIRDKFLKSDLCAEFMNHGEDEANIISCLGELVGVLVPPPISKVATTSTPKKIEVPETVMNAFDMNFTDPWDMLSSFCNHVIFVAHDYRDRIDKAEVFGPYFSLCQASGYGKSKLLHEVSKSEAIFTFYISLADPNGTAFPRAIPELAEKLTASLNFSAMAHSLLYAILTNLYDYVDEVDNPSPSGWCEYYLKRIQDKSFHIPHVSPETMPPKSTLSKLSRGSVLLIAFDEARKLTENEGEKFRELRKLLAKMATHCNSQNLSLCGVFSDTVSKLGNFAAPINQDPSFRGARVDVYDPFFMLSTFDIFPTTLFTLGRPLWNAYDSAWRVNLASIKLMGGKKEWNFLTTKEKYYSALAMMASRFCLRVNPLSHFACAELIGVYMGTCVGISKDRSIVMVDYPSEPVLAEAAAQMMCRNDAYQQMLQELASQIKSSIVTNPGYAGQLVARIILLRCFDFVSLKNANTNNNNNNNNTIPTISESRVSVLDFLCALTNTTTQELVELEKPPKPQEFTQNLTSSTENLTSSTENLTSSTENLTSSQILSNKQKRHRRHTDNIRLTRAMTAEDRAAKEEEEERATCLLGDLSFTHFGAVTYSPRTQHLAQAYERRIGLVCGQNEKAVDSVLPVAHTDSNGELKFGCLGIQVKNETSDSHSGELHYVTVGQNLMERIKHLGDSSVVVLFRLQATHKPITFQKKCITICGLDHFKHISPYSQWIDDLRNILTAFPDPLQGKSMEDIVRIKHMLPLRYKV